MDGASMQLDDVLFSYRMDHGFDVNMNEVADVGTGDGDVDTKAVPNNNKTAAA